MPSSTTTRPTAPRRRTRVALLSGLLLVGVAGLLWLRSGSDTRESFAPPAVAGRADEAPDRGTLRAATPVREAATNEPSVQGEREEAARVAAVDESAPAPPRPAPAALELPENDDPLSLAGLVLFADDSPVPGAQVTLGPWKTTTNVQGAFRLPIEAAAASYRSARETEHKVHVRGNSALVAWLPGWAPAVDEQAGKQWLRAVETNRPADPVVLVLASRSESIAGLVIDHAGRQAEDWRLQLLGRPAFRGRYREVSVEEVASGIDGHYRTEDGRFRFDGLEPGRSYRIRAWDPRTLEQVTSEPILAGTLDALIEAPREPYRARVDGVVVGIDGTPLPDVRCRLSMREYVTGASWYGHTAQELRTDDAGRFHFDEVPRSEILIRFDYQGAATSYELEPEDPGRGLRIELVRSGAFTFVPRTDGATTLRVLDEDLGRLRITQSVGPGRTQSRPAVPVGDEPITGVVPETARWLVLLRDGEELERRELLIRAGRTLELME